MQDHVDRLASDPPATIDLFIDGCAANRLALINLDPFRALEGSAVRPMLTPSLEVEYRAALDHLFVPSYVKVLLGKLLDRCERIPSDAADRLPMPTDAQLALLAQTALVITDDAKLYRRWCERSAGLIAWPSVETHVKSDGRLVDLLLKHARRLPRYALHSASRDGRRLR